DSFGNTPLVAALTPTASLGPAGIVDARKARAEIRAENTARQAIVLALLSSGASVTESGADGIQPLMQLAAWGYSEPIDRSLVEKFTRLGSDVNARDDFGTTALMLAARRGKSSLVRALLSKGADPTIKNCHGADAASLAKLAGFMALANELSS